MNPNKPAWPLDEAAHLAEALREQGAAEDEIAGTAAALLALAAWPAPSPTPAETRQLVERLLPLVPPAVPSTRPAPRPGLLAQPVMARPVMARPGSLAFEFWLMLRLVRAQVSLLLPSFWLASALVVALGGLLVWAAPNVSRSFVLHVIGPLLAYIGVANAFRASGLKMLEFELACPPSPRQLALARLVLVLGYDLALGLLLSLLLWPRGGGGSPAPVLGAEVWLLSLHWLAPLLLGVGLTLWLSLRVPLAQAAAVTYIGWLVLLVFTLIGQNGLPGAASAIPPAVELALGLAGLALIAVALIQLPRAVGGMLPRGG